MKKYVILPIALIVIFVLNTCSVAFCSSLKVKDDRGRVIEILKPPKRLVSLAPTHTEILFALGLEERIVGVTDYCNYPPGTKEKQKIGGFANPDIDRIIALNSDLILAFGTTQIPVVKELEKKGQKVFWIYPRTVKDVLDSFERIGEITGVKINGEQLKESVTQKIKYVQEKTGDIPEDKRPAIFRVMGLDPLGTIGGDSFQTDVFRIAGGRNVFSDIKRDFFQINPDTLIERNPDVIIICGKNTEEIRQNGKNQKGWDNLKAVKEDRILVIPCDLICRPGPRIAESIEKIASYLYPDRFSTYPQRIISLVPSITEQLYLLGLQDRLIGCTVYCKRPEEAESKEKVGTVVEINLEKIVSLKPDLVLATSLTDPKAIEKLKRVGIKVVSLPSPKHFAQIYEQFLELGKITGREKVADKLVVEAKQKVESLTKKVKGLPKLTVFVQVGAKPLFTVTRDSFVNDFIEFAGGENIAQNLNSGLYSREEVLKNNPEVIIIVTMGIVGEEEKEIWGKYKTLKATKNNRIYIMDSYKLCSPTPVSFVDTLEEMVKILHPKKENR